MPINKVYHTWFHKIRQERPNERKTCARNMAWLMTGVFLSRSVHLSRIAGKIPGEAGLNSATRRLSRFLASPAVQVRSWYEPIAKCLSE